jgi:hypothetical protein
MKRPIVASLLAIPVLIGASVMAASQSPPPQPQQQQAYRPGVGDLMTATIQPRHAKIMYAAREANWPLAKYELHQLQEALDRVVQAWPRWKGLPLGGMVEAVGKGPMADVAEAIDAKDAAQFNKAFGQLSEGCNACHQAANVGFVVIKPPDASNFPDQEFRPVKP